MGSRSSSGLECHERIFLSWSEVRDRIKLSRSTVWRCVRDGTFPAPIRISPGRVAWLRTDIDHWIEAQVLASRRRT